MTTVLHFGHGNQTRENALPGNCVEGGSQAVEGFGRQTKPHSVQPGCLLDSAETGFREPLTVRKAECSISEPSKLIGSHNTSNGDITSLAGDIVRLGCRLQNLLWWAVYGSSYADNGRFVAPTSGGAVSVSASLSPGGRHLAKSHDALNDAIQSPAQGILIAAAFAGGHHG